MLGKNMRTDDSKVKSFKRQGITILIILLLFGAYYAFVIPSQRTYFTRRNFRLLTGMGDQIRDVVTNVATSLVNAAARPQPLRSNVAGLAPGPFIKTVHASEREPAAGIQPDLERIRASISLIPNLTLVASSLDTPAPREQLSSPELGFRVVEAANASWLEFTWRGGGSPELRFKVRGDLARLIDPIVHRQDFDDVLLVDTNGEVIFQLSTSAMRVSRLNLPSDKSFQTDLLNYAGMDYKLFAEPVHFAMTPAVSDSPPPITHWILCGLVRADKFRSDTWAVNYIVVIVFVFLALLLIMSWPFLNVWSMGTRDYLRPGDVILLACSAIALCAFLTLPVVDLCAYDRTECELDGRLKDFANEMLGSFKEELGNIVRELDLLNQRFLDPGNSGDRTSVLTNPALVRLGGPDADPYPYFIMATWIDRDGNQLAKWTVRDRNTPLVNVGQRQYFRNLVDGRPWNMTVSNRMVRFSLEPVYSINTGENFSVLSLIPESDRSVVATIDERLLWSTPVLPAGYGFCVIDQQGTVLFHSDERRNLRENFFEECNQNSELRAAVLGRTAERFDLDYGRRTHSLYVTPIPDFPWCLAVFREAQILDTAQVEVVSTSVFLFFAYAVLPVVILLLLYAFESKGYLVWLWPSEQHRGTYVWLTAANLALIVLSVLAVSLSPDPLWLVMLALVVPVLALLLSFFGLTWDGRNTVLSKLGLRLEHFKIPHRYGYVASMGLLLILLAAIPMLAFLKIAFDHEISLMVKQAQLQLTKDLDARAERVWNELGQQGFQRARSRQLPQPELQDFFARRLDSPWDIHTRFFFNTGFKWALPGSSTAASQDTPSSFVLDELLNLLRPHYNELDVLTRGVASDGSADKTWWWTGDGNKLVLTREGTRLHGPRSQNLRIESQKMRLPFPSSSGAAALLIVFGVPFFIIFVVSDRVLLLRIPKPSGISSSVFHPNWRASNPAWGPGKYLLLGPPRSRKTDHLTEAYFARLHKDSFYSIDLRRAEDRKFLEPGGLDELFRNPEKAIVIDHFEYNLQEIEFNRAKLRILQQLSFDDRRTVIVVSNVHPLHFCIEGEDSGGDKKEQPTSSGREAWAEALMPYKKLYCQSKFAGELQPMPEGSTTQQARALYRSLWYTCSPAEQETLHQVAQRRLVRSERAELRALLDRQILVRDPRVHLFDDGFKRFVLMNYRAAAAVPETHEEQAGLWQSLRGPALTVLVLLAGFFFLTQQELWNRSIALITTFLTGVGAVAKGFELFQKSRLKRAPSE
ncbi:MAG TPA: cache domain-containing protein [Acidobacteriota bacterium]|nr:cache domain-containing protein [Acidobacteriota bacterium]